jgi:thioredoxin-like negative regulator of GroEL
MLEGNDSPSESRALVLLEPELIAPHPHRPSRCDAAFLAHLIAMAEQVPQLRERCRAEPQDAAAAYQAALDRFSVQ